MIQVKYLPQVEFTKQALSVPYLSRKLLGGYPTHVDEQLLQINQIIGNQLLNKDIKSEGQQAS